MIHHILRFHQPSLSADLCCDTRSPGCDLKALEDQLSFGTDKDRIKRILQGVTAAQKGECVAFAPEFFRNSGYIRIGKIRGDRRAPHSGGNVSAKPVSAAEGESQSFGSSSARL